MNYNYFIPLISFSGLIFGILLARIARDEIRPGLDYFILFERIILGFIILGLLLNIDKSFSGFLFLFAGVIFGYFISLFVNDYLFLGLVCSISFLFLRSIFFVLNVLVFLYGLPKGTLYRKFQFDKVYKNFLYFIIPFLVLIFALSNLSADMINFLIGISCGGLFAFLIKKSFINF